MARRISVTLRMSPTGLAAVDAFAERAGVNRSEMIRTLVAEAVAARTPREARPVPKVGGR